MFKDANKTGQKPHIGTKNIVKSLIYAFLDASNRIDNRYLFNNLAAIRFFKTRLDETCFAAWLWAA